MSEESMRALASAVSDPVTGVDLDGLIVSWNDACQRLWGWDATEVSGRRLPHFPKHRRATIVSVLRRAAAASGPVVVEEITERKDGSRVGGSMTLVPVEESGAVTQVMCVHTSISSDSRLEGALAEQAGLLSGELRRHVTALLGYAQLLGRPEIDSDPYKRERVVRALRARSVQMSALAEDLSVLERFQTGALELVIGPAELAGVVADAVGSVEHSLAGCRFHVEYDSALAPVDVDSRLLRRAIEKMLVHAAEVTGESGEVSVSVAREGNEALVRVSARAGDRAGSHAAAHAGVGLAVLSRIAEAHEGSVVERPLRGGGVETTLRFTTGSEASR